MELFTLHGLFYIIAWTIEGDLLQEVSASGVILLLVYSLAIFINICFSFACIYMYLFVCFPGEEYMYIH